MSSPEPLHLKILFVLFKECKVLVPRAEGSHPIPYRTRQLSPSAPMVASFQEVRVGRCQDGVIKIDEELPWGFLA